MKTNVFKNLKQTMFLLLVALSSFVGFAQTTQPHVIINPIGGSKTPDAGGFIEIGGQRPAPMILHANLETGGGNSTTKPPITIPFSETQSVVVFLGEVGDNTIGSIFDIGSRQNRDFSLIALLDSPDTGGGQTLPTPTKPILSGLDLTLVTNSMGIHISLII